MVSNKERLGGMFSMMAGLAVGGAALGMVGASGMSSGFQSITSTGIGLGIIGTGKKMWKW